MAIEDQGIVMWMNSFFLFFVWSNKNGILLQSGASSNLLAWSKKTECLLPILVNKSSDDESLYGTMETKAPSFAITLNDVLFLKKF